MSLVADTQGPFPPMGVLCAHCTVPGWGLAPVLERGLRDTASVNTWVFSTASLRPPLGRGGHLGRLRGCCGEALEGAWHVAGSKAVMAVSTRSFPGSLTCGPVPRPRGLLSVVREIALAVVGLLVS